jgi:hypothetical protein
MTAPSIDEYLEQLNTIPEQALSTLYQIKRLDK